MYLIKISNFGCVYIFSHNVCGSSVVFSSFRMHVWLEQSLSEIIDLLKTVLQAIGFLGQRDAIRLDLTRHGLRVEKAKVGPLGSVLFDSAVSIYSSTE